MLPVSLAAPVKPVSEFCLTGTATTAGTQEGKLRSKRIIEADRDKPPGRPREQETPRTVEWNRGWYVSAKLQGSCWGGVNFRYLTREGVSLHHHAFCICFRNAVLFLATHNS